MKDKAAKVESENNEVPEEMEIPLELIDDEEALSRLQGIINRYYKMNIKCDLILYKINRLRKAQQVAG